MSPRGRAARARAPSARHLTKFCWPTAGSGIFFILIICAFVGTLAQDVWLEGFGGEVLGMTVGDTTRLSEYWGPGVLISMLLSGIILLPLIGYMRLMRIGFAASALVFAGVIVVGVMGNAAIFRWLVFVMGLGTGDTQVQGCLPVW